MNNESEIKDLLMSTGRAGMEDLIKKMKFGGFFTAPCSGQYHLSKEGGLAEHSMNVYRTMKKMCEVMAPEITEESIIVCALLHDLGKMGDRNKPNYIENKVRSKTKNKDTDDYDMVRSESKPYTTNPDLLYEEHEIRSVIIAERCIWLSEEEESAILHHNGLFSKLDSTFQHGYDRNKLSFILHTADMYCSRFIEE